MYDSIRGCFIPLRAFRLGRYGDRRLMVVAGSAEQLQVMLSCGQLQLLSNLFLTLKTYRVINL